ncbi:DUF6963 family protein [Microvirga sp. GCM10011540]|uniref:DUF6963 family protein n=1 Tax=Microvirga sp. GCM10011540 TaxID=3317338 RepID=UPI0036189D25
MASINRIGPMTIGVAATGERAGASVQAAVLGAELLGRGAIGGFTVFAILDAEGHVYHRITQRGGIGVLDLPESWLMARHAAAISSGPDRPEPLTQFLPGLDGIGLVTGHRLPNSLDRDGRPVNHLVLTRLSAGEEPQKAVDGVLSQCPELDAGLIAINTSGQIGIGNSERVRRRADGGCAVRETQKSRVALLHNSIYSNQPLAERLVDLAWSYLSGEPTGVRLLFLRDSVPVQLATKDRVHVDATGTVTCIESPNIRLQSTLDRATTIYLGSEIWHGAELIGHAATELITAVDQGRISKPAENSSLSIVMETRKAILGEPTSFPRTSSRD